MRDGGFFVPPEWAPQTAMWVGWPSRADLWGDDLDGARAEVAGLARRLAEVVRVKLVAGDAVSAEAARAAVSGAAEVHVLPMGDIWLRDTGPIIRRGPDGLEGRVFVFNGWGRKYELEGDTETAANILEAEGLPARGRDFVLEGGAVDHDGAGTILTTRQCLLNPNRNPGWDEAAAEAALADAFGARRIVWLGDGLLGDHTDGHVDNLARFIGPGRVVCQTPSGADDPNADVLRQAEIDLRAAGLEVATLPSPGLVVDDDGAPAPASHMNFLISNGIVVLPTYEPVRSAEAAGALADLLPHHKIRTAPSRHVLTGGGSFHCCTQQIPRAD